MAPRPLIAGNWKMNGSLSALTQLEQVMAALSADEPEADVLICPPFPLIDRFSHAAAGSAVQIGAQDCHTAASGAHTGDVSAPLLADCGATWVILGHSERRAGHGETNELVKAKQAAAWGAGLKTIVCLGESEAERSQGRTLDIVAWQLAGSLAEGASAGNTAIAYEPIWAIGTGKTPTPADIAEVHGHIRRLLVSRLGADAVTLRLLYGGSVKPDNAAGILAAQDVNGALVGGASLKADDLLAIVKALPAG